MVGWHPGIDDATAERAAASVCAELRARGLAAQVGPEGTGAEEYRVVVIHRTGTDRYVLQVSGEREGVRVSYAQTQASSLEGIDALAPLVVTELLGPAAPSAAPSVAPSAAPSAARPAASAAPSVDATPQRVSPKVRAEPETRRSAPFAVHTGFFVGGGALYGATPGLSDPKGLGFVIALAYQWAHVSVGAEYHQRGRDHGDVGGSATVAAISVYQAHVLARTYFGPLGAFFVGGGLGYLRTQANLQSYEAVGYVMRYASYAQLSGSGLGFAAVAGVELLRDTPVRLALELRVDVPFFSLEGSVSDSAYAPENGLWTATRETPSKGYRVPLSASATFLF